MGIALCSLGEHEQHQRHLPKRSSGVCADGAAEMSLYNVLGVVPGASAAEIRHAYRQRALLTHPDKGGNEDQFHAVAAAFDTLSDPASRASYDEAMSMQRPSASSAPASRAFPLSQRRRVPMQAPHNST